MRSDDMRGIAVAPKADTPMYTAFVQTVKESGAELVSLEEADALIWADPLNAHLYPETIASAPQVKWVQLPYAGIEDFADYLDHERVWTCGKGVYADPLAEYTITALLVGFRDFHEFVAANSWSPQTGRNLLGADITVLGGGGITRSLVRLLEPWNCKVTVVRRSRTHLEGAVRTVTLASVTEAVAGADAVVVALALTDETRHIVDRKLLSAMNPETWLINVGRGGHVDHAALADSLRSGAIAGAVLDVTDPEPLPSSSELWSFPNCIITPHTANTPEMGLPLITQRLRDNVERWLAGETLLGLVDVSLGY